MDSERCLEPVLDGLKGFDEILVCDLESTDRTLGIARRHGARILTYPRGKERNPMAGAVRNFAIRSALYEWVLVVRDDEIVPPQLRTHLCRIASETHRSEQADGYRIPRRNHIMHRFNSAQYPDFQLRFLRKENAEWQPGDDMQPQVKGRIERLNSARSELALIHVARSSAQIAQSLDRIAASTDGADYYRRVSIGSIIRRCSGVFLGYYVVRGGIRYGLPGFLRACNKAMEEYFLMSKIYEDRVMPAFFSSLPKHEGVSEAKEEKA